MAKQPPADRTMQIFKDSRFRKGTFLRRPNRFLVECDTGDRVVRAHLPNPGRLRELLLPGSTLFLQRHGRESGRRTGYTAVAVEREGEPVLLHTSVTNDAAHFLLGKGLVPGLEGYRVARREVTVGRSRFAGDSRPRHRKAFRRFPQSAHRTKEDRRTHRPPLRAGPRRGAGESDGQGDCRLVEGGPDPFPPCP